MSTYDDQTPFPVDEESAARRRRPPRKGPDINELPVWTWVAILLVVVVIGGALWAMTRSGDKKATATPAPSAGAPQPGTGTPAPAGAATATPVIAANTPVPPPPEEITVGIRVVVAGTGETKLRLRSGPGTDYATLLIVPDGTKFKVLEGPQSQGGHDWWRVQMDDGTIGWAVEQYLVPIGQ